MMLFPWILCGALFIIVVVLFIKIILLKKSMDEICAELTEHLSNDTNTLISISSGDRHARHFANELNKQLRLLRRQRQQYMSGSRDLREAVTNISHDLRTPLTAISGYLELLEQEEKTAEAGRYLSVIGNRVEMMKQLTGELFRYSVIISPENHSDKERIALNGMLEESVSAFYTALNERDIVPEIQMPESRVFRTVDRSALSRVFSNLINNAIKYSDGDLEITLSETGKITFANTAASLNKVLVGRLFDRFYTVETAEKSTGLGLAITRTLIEQMNGTIEAEYEDDKLSIGILLPEDQG